MRVHSLFLKAVFVRETTRNKVAKRSCVLRGGVGVAALVTALHAQALPVEWNGGAGTWTTPSNWTPAQVPTAADDVTINKSGDVTQAGLPINTNALKVGFRTNGQLFPDQDADGALSVSNGDANVGGDLDVGVSDITFGNDRGSSSGSLTTSGSALNPGNLRVSGDTAIGNFVRGPSGTARGVVAVENGNFFARGTVSVGTSEGIGDGDGELYVAGDLSDMDTLHIGRVKGDGDAAGTATVDGRIIDMSNDLHVGVLAEDTASATGDATGRLEVGSGIVSGGDVLIGVAEVDGGSASSVADGTLSILSGGFVPDPGDAKNELFAVGATFSQASAIGQADIEGPVVDIGELAVGFTSSKANAGNATGEMNVSNGSIISRFGSNPKGVSVGRALHDGDADGTLTVDGDITGFVGVDVGVAGQSSGSGVGTADGVFAVTGNLSGVDSGDFRVGDSTRGGEANGQAVVDGAVSGFDRVEVGTAFAADAIGKAKFGSLLANDAISVGVAVLPGATANGELEVAGILEVAGLLQVGSGVSGGEGIGRLEADQTAALTMRVGYAGQDGSADGNVVVNGRAFAETAQIGVAGFVGSADLLATGKVQAASGLYGFGTGSTLEVGATRSASSAQGEIDIDSFMSSFSQIDIGLVGVGAEGNASGEAEVTGNNVSNGTFSTADLYLATTLGSGDSEGHLKVSGGSVLDFTRIGVGRVGGGASGNANASLEVIGGNVRGTGFGLMEIGASSGSGNATGRLVVDGSITDVGAINVGYGTGSGDGRGSLELSNGTLETDYLTVALSSGTGEVEGVVDLMDNMATVTNDLFLGDGATLGITVDGFLRGDEYGAIDAAFAYLDGTLDLDFLFQPVAGVFDLIISDGDSNMFGDFDTVAFNGLSAGTLVQYGVVLDAGRQIYRLEVGVGDPIPEPPVNVPVPATFTLVVTGLAFARRQSRRVKPRHPTDRSVWKLF